MEKLLSRSDQLIASMHHAALQALAQAPGGQLRKRDLMQAIEAKVPLDEWARTVYEGSGHTRWRSIFNFSSVGLLKGGYVTNEARGIWRITDEGRVVATQPFDSSAFLTELNRRYKLWENSQIKWEVVTLPEAAVQNEVEDGAALEAPEERMARTVKAAHDALSAELIEAIKQCEPAFFEKLVVQLLLKMGYGGSRQEAGRAVGRSGDGGIDEDRLGLDAIYLQAKRWEGVVGRPEVMKFVGALAGQRATKGVFITTSWFTQEAKDYAASSQYKVVLIDGTRLSDLMIEHNLGVSVVASYHLKRIDSDFFADE